MRIRYIIKAKKHGQVDKYFSKSGCGLTENKDEACRYRLGRAQHLVAMSTGGVYVLSLIKVKVKT